MKRMSDIKMNTQIIQEGDRYDVSKVSQVQVNVDGSNFKPPMPLPVAHNDWSRIKEGYSYMYSSKIPIDMKDMED